jgi:hypothetical protein
LRHASTLLQSAWWGALEPQREALREAYRKRNDSDFAKTSNQWSVLSLVVILLTLLGFGGFFAISPHPYQGFSIYDAYGIACGLRTAMEVWSRTQHSSVFAVSRVRRPLLSLVFVDVFEVVGLLYAWFRIGPFAFALMLVLSGLLRVSLTLLFVRITRNHVGLPSQPLRLWREFCRIRWRTLPYRRSLGFAIGNLSLQLDSLAILLLSAGSTGSDWQHVRLLLHALAPLLGAGYGWSRIFYFDFKSLARFHSPLLAVRFGRLLDRIALFYPFVLSLLAWPVVESLAPGFLGNAPLLLWLFVVARSCFALRQIEAFSYVDVRVQVRQLLVLCVGVGLGFLLLPPDNLRLLLASTMLFLAAFIGPRAKLEIKTLEPGCVLGLESWLAHVRTHEAPLRLVSVTVDRSSTKVGAIRRSLIAQGFIEPMLQVGRSQWAFCVPTAEGDNGAIRRRLISATAGAASRLFVGENTPNGRMLLREGLIESSTLSWLLGVRRLPKRVKVPFETLMAQFETHFPGGTCLTPHQGRLSGSDRETRRGLNRLVTGLSTRGPSNTTRLETLHLATYCPSGKATILFLLPKTAAGTDTFMPFIGLVSEASLQATLAEL